MARRISNIGFHLSGYSLLVFLDSLWPRLGAAVAENNRSSWPRSERVNRHYAVENPGGLAVRNSFAAASAGVVHHASEFQVMSQLAQYQ